jgi:hypothetical protein
MKFVNIELDFTDVQNLEDMHKELFQNFGFPDFYGRNFHAFIDCVSSLRHPEDGMTSFFLKDDEFLSIKVKSLASCSELILNNFILAIENINERERLNSRPNMIYLILI